MGKREEDVVVRMKGNEQDDVLGDAWELWVGALVVFVDDDGDFENSDDSGDLNEFEHGFWGTREHEENRPDAQQIYDAWDSNEEVYRVRCAPETHEELAGVDEGHNEINDFHPGEFILYISAREVSYYWAETDSGYEVIHPFPYHSVQ